MVILHRWFGITVGFYFALLGISGSYLVYREPIQQWLGSDLRQAQTNSNEIHLVSIIQSAQVGLGVDKLPSRLVVSDDPNRTVEVAFSGLPGMGRGVITAFVDPSNNSFKGSENFRQTVGGKIFVFHHDLFFGQVGRTVMAYAGILMLFLLLGGIYLWWPKTDFFRRAFRLGPMTNAIKTQLELHKFIGFYSLFLVLMVTFSGVYLSRPDWFQKRTPRPNESAQGDKKEVLTVDFVKLQEALNTTVKKPWNIRIDAKAATYTVTTRDEKSLRFDLNSFAPLEPLPPRPKNMRALQHDLHAGHFWGIIGEILVFTSGLVPVFLYVSGVYIWWKKSKLKSKKDGKLKYAS